ncbi:hypothetical protein [Oceanobacillus sp. 1P07AA]|uniref:hypothetical protein n=1 Tax=Oceanobacillus sp. 1P07AA TaxID=3132293 RepID=UPI0039A60FB1
MHSFYMEEDEMKDTLSSNIPHIFPVKAFAHYVGNKHEEMKMNYRRVHECNCYEKQLD